MNLETFSAVLMRELQARVARGDMRLVALVQVDDDQVLREQLAQATADITAPMIAVFEPIGRKP